MKILHRTMKTKTTIDKIYDKIYVVKIAPRISINEKKRLRRKRNINWRF